MGIVFRAVAGPSDQPVALKVLRAELAQDAIYARRFVHEARAAREISHRHLVPILDEGTAQGGRTSRSEVPSADRPSKSSMTRQLISSLAIGFASFDPGRPT
jgi:serine/threonine protein kinase